MKKTLELFVFLTAHKDYILLRMNKILKNYSYVKSKLLIHVINMQVLNFFTIYFPNLNKLIIIPYFIL